MKLRDQALIIVSLALIILSGMLVLAYFRQARELAAAGAYAQAKQETIDALERNKRLREAQHLKAVAALEEERDAIRSQKQAVKVIEKYVPAASAEPVAELRREELETAAPGLAARLPNAPSYGIVTERTLMEFARYTVECQVQRAELVKCAADLGDTTQQFEAAVAQRDRWEKAAKGGGRGRRVVETIGKVGAGVVIGLALARR